MSKRLAGKAEKGGEEEEMKEDDEGQKEAASPLTCDPSLTEVEATSIPSSKFYTACMYHSLLLHIQIIQKFTHHAQSASSGITDFPSSLNQGTITQSYASTSTLECIHTLFLG